MRLGVLDHRGHHLFGDAPLGLEKQQALPAHTGGILLGPFEIGLRLDDHFQFVGPFERLVQGRLPALGRQTHPVEDTAERVRTRCFQENLQPPLAQRLREHAQRIEQRLASRDDDGLRRARRRTVDHGLHIGRRIEFRVPRILGVAPAAAHVAPAETDEIGGFPGVESLALNGVEILDQRQQASAVEQCGIGRGRHHSVTT